LTVYNEKVFIDPINLERQDYLHQLAINAIHEFHNGKIENSNSSFYLLWDEIISNPKLLLSVKDYSIFSQIFLIFHVAGLAYLQDSTLNFLSYFVTGKFSCFQQITTKLKRDRLNLFYFITSDFCYAIQQLYNELKLFENNSDINQENIFLDERDSRYYSKVIQIVSFYNNKEIVNLCPHLKHFQHSSFKEEELKQATDPEFIQMANEIDANINRYVYNQLKKNTLPFNNWQSNSNTE